MNIISFGFVAFLAVVVIAYYSLPLKVRKWLPLVASAVFWSIGGVFGTAYLLLFSCVIWGSARGIARRREQEKSSKIILIPAVVLTLSMMMLLKEYQRVPGWAAFGEMTSWLAVPLGISYFTFQGVGYLMDVNKGKVQAERNFLKVLLFCGFFGQLSQGPIGTWRDLSPELDQPHRFDPDLFTESVFLTAWGFFKKLVIADRIAPFVSSALSASEPIPGWAALLTVIAYTLELYTDFSGGIDIVRGAAGMLGIHLARNFDRPFFATSVADYWRRWHISLGAWFRTYVLYPMATSRAGTAIGRLGKKLFGTKVGLSLPSALAAFAVFVLIGLWHTFHWNALLYGVWFGLISMLAVLLEPLFKKLRKKLGITKKTRWFKPIGMVRTWFAVLIAQYFACTDTPQQAWNLMVRTVTAFDFSTFMRLDQLAFREFVPAEWIVAAIAIVILLTVDILTEKYHDLAGRAAKSPLWIRWPLLMLLLLTILIFGVYGYGYEASAFVYAGF